MDETMHDYMAKKSDLENSEIKEYFISIQFSVGSVLTDLLGEAREKICFADDAERICGDIKGRGWNLRLKSRFKIYKKHNRMPFDLFQRLCDYLDKDPNLLLNQGKCAITLGGYWIFFDPYRIMQSKEYRYFRPFDREGLINEQAIEK